MECTSTLLPLIVGCSLLATPSLAQDIAELGRSAAERIGANILSLSAKWMDGRPDELGFGFVAGCDERMVFIATANHTLRGQAPDEIAEGIELRSRLKPWEPIEGTLVQLYDETIDLGVVAVPAAALEWKSNVLPPATRELRALDPVWTVRRAQQAVWEVNLDHGILAGRNPVRHQILIDDLPAFPGSSGAPVVSAFGLVGMIVMDSEIDGTSALEISAIRDQFANWNVPWCLTNEPDATVIFEGGVFQRGASPRDLERLRALLEPRFPDRTMPSFDVATPPKNIELSPFEIDAREVTWGEFKEYLSDAGLPNPLPDRVKQYLRSETQPAVGVTWAEADAYCRARGMRLPTEAEWERAARGTSGRLFSWGNSLENLTEVACGECAEDGDALTGPAEVANSATDVTPEGIADLAANAREWVTDWYGGGFYAEPTLRDPENIDPSEYRVVRGASWFDPIQNLPAFRRGAVSPGFRDPGIGFRCARRIAAGSP